MHSSSNFNEILHRDRVFDSILFFNYFCIKIIFVQSLQAFKLQFILVGKSFDDINFLFYNRNTDISLYADSTTFYRLIQQEQQQQNTTTKKFVIEKLDWIAVDNTTDEVLLPDNTNFLCLDRKHYYLYQTQFGFVKAWSTNVDPNNPDSDTLIDAYKLALNDKINKWQWKCITVKFFISFKF